MPSHKHNIIVNKFGGSIFGPKEFVQASVLQVKLQRTLSMLPIVVVSALKGVTDELVELSRNYTPLRYDGIKQIHYDFIDRFSLSGGVRKQIDALLNRLKTEVERGNKQGRDRDRILSYGERLSSILFVSLLNQEGIPSLGIGGGELGIITDDLWGDASINEKESVPSIRRKLREYLNNTVVPVVTGFIGKTKRGQTTTLGRGGSDTTACFIGAALKVRKVILWKDVPGVLSTDPRIVPHAKTIARMDYEEAEESGKVIHDKSMQFIRKEHITVEVADIRDARKKTIVTKEGSRRGGVKMVSAKNNLILLIIAGDKIKRAGALAEISHVIARDGINMVFIRNTRDHLYIVIEKDGNATGKAIEAIKQLNYSLSYEDVSQVTVIGHLSWHLVERFNHLLHSSLKRPEFGAFPYRNCVRLEAIVQPHEMEKMVKIFHKEFVE